MIESVKLAEDRSGDLIVRLYEARGARAVGTVTAGCEVTGIVETDLLERAAAEPAALVGVDGASAQLRLRAFQLVTLRFRRN